MDHERSAYAEFSSNYLPDLFNYGVPLPHKGGDGDGSIGSGVLVKGFGSVFGMTAGYEVRNGHGALPTAAPVHCLADEAGRPRRRGACALRSATPAQIRVKA
jgi:hypothetical protein